MRGGANETRWVIYPRWLARIELSDDSRSG